MHAFLASQRLATLRGSLIKLSQTPLFQPKDWSALKYLFYKIKAFPMVPGAHFPHLPWSLCPWALKPCRVIYLYHSKNEETTHLIHDVVLRINWDGDPDVKIVKDNKKIGWYWCYCYSVFHAKCRIDMKRHKIYFQVGIHGKVPSLDFT